MTLSKLICSILFHQLIVLFSFSCNNVGAFNHIGGSSKHVHLKSDLGPKTPPQALQAVPSRRQFFFQTAKTASFAGAAIGIFSNPVVIPVAVAADITPSNAKDQWKQGLATVDDLLENWSTVATGGDAIRGKLGTQGTTSPLFQIDKAFRALRDSEYVDDFIEFQETAEEFGLTLSRADSMAYSANFAGGSGKPTPPAVYIEKSKTEVIEMKRIANKLDAMIK